MSIAIATDKEFATRKDTIAQWVAHATAKANDDVVKTTERVVTYAAYRIDTQSSAIGDHLDAIATRDIWASIAEVTGNIAQERADDGREDHADALFEAIDYIATRLTEKLIRDWLSGGSTSQLSNACTAYERKAASQFVQHYIVEGAREVIAYAKAWKDADAAVAALSLGVAD